MSFHLTPYTEDLRHPEIELILTSQKAFSKRILMGDLNSLSSADTYPSNLSESFNEIQLKKFTTAGKLRFDVIDKILSNGYIDSAVQLQKNKENTVPTPINKDQSHASLRLDYIFVSKELTLHLQSYTVVKNQFTNQASDHYPVVVVLE